MEYDVFFKNAGRSISSNAWWNMIISHIFFNDVDGNDVNLWMVHQATPGCFAPFWPSTDPRSSPTTPRSSCHIQAIQGWWRNTRFLQPNPGPEAAFLLLSGSTVQKELGSTWKHHFLMMLRMLKKKKNILDTTWHHSKISPDTHFLHPRLAILSWVWVELTIPDHPICFPILSCWVIFKIKEIWKNHWKIPLVIQSTQYIGILCRCCSMG